MEFEEMYHEIHEAFDKGLIDVKLVAAANKMADVIRYFHNRIKHHLNPLEIPAAQFNSYRIKYRKAKKRLSSIYDSIPKIVYAYRKDNHGIYAKFMDLEKTPNVLHKFDGDTVLVVDHKIAISIQTMVWYRTRVTFWEFVSEDEYNKAYEETLSILKN